SWESTGTPPVGPPPPAGFLEPGRSLAQAVSTRPGLPPGQHGKSGIAPGGQQDDRQHQRRRTACAWSSSSSGRGIMPPENGRSSATPPLCGEQAGSPGSIMTPQVLAATATQTAAPGTAPSE